MLSMFLSALDQTIVATALPTIVGELGGLELPAGVHVAPCIYLVHRREDLYPDARTWRPSHPSREPVAVSIDLLDEEEVVLDGRARGERRRDDADLFDHHGAYGRLAHRR